MKMLALHEAFARLETRGRAARLSTLSCVAIVTTKSESSRAGHDVDTTPFVQLVLEFLERTLLTLKI